MNAPGTAVATSGVELTHPKEWLQRFPPQKRRWEPASSRPEPTPQDASPSFSPRNPPTEHTPDGRRRLSDPVVGADNLTPRHRPGAGGRSAPESGQTGFAGQRLPPAGR